MESRKKFRRNLREPKGFSPPSMRPVSVPGLLMQLFQPSGGVRLLFHVGKTPQTIVRAEEEVTVGHREGGVGGV